MHSGGRVICTRGGGLRSWELCKYVNHGVFVKGVGLGGPQDWVGIPGLGNHGFKLFPSPSLPSGPQQLSPHWLHVSLETRPRGCKHRLQKVSSLLGPSPTLP